MSAYSLSHVSDENVVRRFVTLAAHDRSTTAQLVAHIAEIDERRLFLPAAYPSMVAYCMHELRLTEHAALGRITVARSARKHPSMFELIETGSLSLASAKILCAHLTSANADELLRAAANKTVPEVERLIAERSPRSELLPLVEAIPDTQLVSRRVDASDESLVSRRVEAPAPRSTVAPLAPQRFALHLSISRAAYDKLQRVQELLSHTVRRGDVADVIERSLDLALAQLETSRCAATNRPQRKPRPTHSPRHIAANVKRAVRERDGNRCTFVGTVGRRCEERSRLQYDHIVPVARGGESTVENVRLLCNAHNQHAADCTFGRDFMERKRRDTKAAAEHRRVAREQTERADLSDVVAALTTLGYRTGEARQAAQFTDSAPDAPLEDRIKLALSYFRARVLDRSRARSRDD